MPDGSGGKFIQKDDGFGDLRLALPLKRYFNLDGKSGSWTIKPMVRIPLSDKDEYDFYYKEFGAGLGAGYEAETADFFFGIGTGGWIFDGDRPAELHTTLDFGYNFETKANGSVFGKPISITKTMSQRLCRQGRFSLQPQRYHSFENRVEVRPLRSPRYSDHGNGDVFKVGIGWVFVYRKEVHSRDLRLASGVCIIIA